MKTVLNKKQLDQLEKKKYRKEQGIFLVEGEKGVREVLASGFEVTHLLCTEQKVDLPLVKGLPEKIIFQIVSEKWMKKVSAVETPPGVIALVKKKHTSLDAFDMEKPIILLDNVADPGNVGTIIRTADWFGVDQILLSEESVDLYNTKVVRATMGSLFRSKAVQSSDVMQDLDTLTSGGYTVAALTLDGTPIEQQDLGQKTVYVLGSESHGVRSDIVKLSEQITISGSGKAESLNVAVAAGIILHKVA